MKEKGFIMQSAYYDEMSGVNWKNVKLRNRPSKMIKETEKLGWWKSKKDEKSL